MEQKHLRQIESWFKELNRKMDRRFDEVDRRFEKMDTKFENRYTALLNVCTTTRGSLNKTQEDVAILKGDVSVLKEDVSSLKGDVSTLKQDVIALKQDNVLLQTGLESTHLKIDNLSQDFKKRLERVQADLAGLRTETRGFQDKYDARLTTLELAVRQLNSQ